jgi:hypothetical protein
MTTIEHLQRIKSRCQELLTTAETRTPGGWAFDPENIGGGSWPYYGLINAESGESVPVHVLVERPGNATFIASCAGPAEAGWRATIAAVDCALVILEFYEGSHLNDVQKRELDTANDSALAIIVAWPEEVLN